MSETATSQNNPERRPTSLDERRLQLPDILPGNKCRDCGEVYYPRRMRCSHCSSTNLEDIAITARGKLASYTTLTMAPPGSVMEAPYSIGTVVTPERAHIMTVLTEPDPERLKTGMDVEMVVVKVKEDAEGNDVMAYKFKPV